MQAHTFVSAILFWQGGSFMRLFRGSGCIFGVIFAVVIAIVALIAIIILINALKSIDYRQAAEELKDGVKEFNETLRSVNSATSQATTAHIFAE